MAVLEEVYKNKIPKEDYQVSVRNGEVTGLIIELESSNLFVNINFGAVSAMRMLDEGIVLEDIFNKNEVLTFEDNLFSNTIYKVPNGEFSDFIKASSNELYEYLDLKHYAIFTMNYVIEVVSKWEPSIEVVKK